MKGIIRLAPPLLAFCLAACAAVDGPERVARLEENQTRDRQVMDLRMSGAEDRLTKVEGDVSALQRNAAPAGRQAGRAPAPPASQTSRAPQTQPEPQASRARHSNERLPAEPQATGTAALGGVPATPEIPYLPKPETARFSGSPAPSSPAPAVPAPAPVASAPAAPAPVASAPVPAPAAPAPVASAPVPAPAAPAPVASAPAPGPESGPGLVPVSMGGKAPAPAPAPAPRSGGHSRSGNSGKTGSGAYDAALALYNKGQYEKAQGDFAAFIQSSPGNALVPNALYWQGECHYSLGRYSEAIMSFKDVAAKYPKHDKAAAALLKAGYAYERLKDTANARFYWQLLLDDFPRSAPAALARKKMGGAG